MNRITFVIPVYNEVKTVENSIKEVLDLKKQYILLKSINTIAYS